MYNFRTLTTMLLLSGAIKVWSSGEDITSTDLNANFAHIHNKMVGGHGARLVDADVSPTANITTSKLAAYRFIPKAWVVGQCNGTTCVILESENVTSVARSGGNNTVTLAYTPTNATFATVISYNTGKGFCNTQGLSTSAPQITAHCYDDTGTTVEGVYTILVFDAD